jgi:hypothetical protein
LGVPDIGDSDRTPARGAALAFKVSRLTNIETVELEKPLTTQEQAIVVAIRVKPLVRGAVRGSDRMRGERAND